MTQHGHRDFNLSKVNFSKVGLTASYKITVSGNEELEEGTHTLDFKDVSYTYEPSEDLLKLKEELKLPLVYTLGIEQSLDILLKSNKKTLADDVLEAKKKEIYLEMFDNIRVYGVSFGGEGQSRHIIITGGIESANGISTINTARIFLAQSKLGYEEELENVVRLLEQEVYNYFINNKQAQYSLFGDTSKELQEA